MLGQSTLRTTLHTLKKVSLENLKKHTQTRLKKQISKQSTLEEFLQNVTTSSHRTIQFESRKRLLRTTQTQSRSQGRSVLTQLKSQQKQLEQYLMQLQVIRQRHFKMQFWLKKGNNVYHNSITKSTKRWTVHSLQLMISKRQTSKRLRQRQSQKHRTQQFFKESFQVQFHRREMSTQYLNRFTTTLTSQTLHSIRQLLKNRLTQQQLSHRVTKRFSTQSVERQTQFMLKENSKQGKWFKLRIHQGSFRTMWLSKLQSIQKLQRHLQQWSRIHLQLKRSKVSSMSNSTTFLRLKFQKLKTSRGLHHKQSKLSLSKWSLI